jgi:hypothetical protein
MSAAERLLSKLPNLREVRSGEFFAGCPAHCSRQGRPLHVNVLGDGRILIHPFCSCSVSDVLAALGLSLGDLYEKPLEHRTGPARSRVPARDLLALIDHEALTVGMIALQFRETRELSDEDWQRLATAASRIGKARDHAGA